MNWTTPADIRQQLERLWNNGTLPGAVVAENGLFPLTLSLRTPRSADITQQLEAVKTWAEALKAMPRVRLLWHTVNNRVQGTQTLPKAACVETLDDALAILGKTNTAQEVMALHAITLQKAPFLENWFFQNTLKAYRHKAEWERLLTLAVWIKDNPAPGIYLRQVDLPGIHTKFIEQHKAILSQLFQQALPAPQTVPAALGHDQFEHRHGFRTKPLRVRFRVLDAALSPFPGSAHPDITLDSASFATLPFAGCRIFIVENESSFLAFPHLEKALVIFGAGYCWNSLKPAVWMKDCPVFYWGDLDTHGFRILDHLRAFLPHTRSFLMDEPTLLAYRPFWETEPDPVRHALTHLTQAEQAVFTTLQTHLLAKNLRLEQERIYLSDLHKALAQLTAP